MARQMFRRGIVACDECIKNCITVDHLEQRGPSSTVRRFFKIMHGKNCFEFLYLPPKFSRNVRDLVGQKTQIEDSNGQKWTVGFSLVDGALAFLEGWHKFVEDHQLEHGELLVFNYTKHRHFVVQIYGLSACEIMDFNRGRKHPKKRPRSDQETIFQDESHQIRNKRFSLTSNMEDPSCMLIRDSGKYEVEDREILFDLSNFEMGKKSSVAEKSETSLDRNITAVETQIREQIDMRNDTQMSIPLGDQKNYHLCGIATDAFQSKLSGSSNSSKGVTHDVSKFQPGMMENNCLHGISSDALQRKPPCSSDSDEGMPDNVSNFQAGEMENNHLRAIFSDSLRKKPSGDSDSRKGIPDEIKFQTGGANNIRSCGIFSETFLAKSSSNRDSSKDMLDEVPKFLACETSVSPHFVAEDTKSPYICSSLLAESDHSINTKPCAASVTSSMHKDPFGKSPTTFEKELVILGEVYDFLRIPGDGKKGSILGMKCGQISSVVIKTEPDMDNVLDPARASDPFSAEVKSLAFVELPLCMPSIQGRRERGQGKIIYLKDSTKRLWPVLYPSKFGIRAITNGWRTFCKENRINTGDVCRFQIEKYMPSCVLKVDIICKDGRSNW